VEERRRSYYPFKPYCEACGHDATEVLGYADETVEYHCHGCGHQGSMSLADGARISGKLVWKVDWPMRWKYEGVHYEPAGEDHHAPTGSFTVGATIVRDVYGAEPPLSTVYSFVTLSGRGGKMSGSTGNVVTPRDALEVFEPVVIRWPYVQRQPAQSISIDFSARGIQRQYDHWDQFAEAASAPDARPDQTAVYRLCTEAASGTIERTRRPVSFRLLASAADITNANRAQIARIVTQHLDGAAGGSPVSLEDLEPRLTCAIEYATKILEPHERTVVRTTFDELAWAELDEPTREGIRLLAGEMRENWTLDGLTALIYSIPKVMQGMPRDAAPTPELKRAQREFFKALYRLLCSSDTGPRLPTLFLSLGPDVTERLLGAQSADFSPRS
jgi:lysyl-tRNA synthetase class 1